MMKTFKQPNGLWRAQPVDVILKRGRPVNIARQAARAAGITFYYGAACRFDHAGLRYVSTGGCVHCMVGQAPGYRTPGDVIRAERLALAGLVLG